MKKQQYLKNILSGEEGYSLTELLVVLVIIGILIMIAVPIYQNITTRAKTTEAKMMLKTVHTLQKTYYLEHDRYAEDLDAIGFEQNKLITEEGSARYAIAIESASINGYQATATSVVDFDKDGTYNVWQVTEEGQIEQKVKD